MALDVNLADVTQKAQALDCRRIMPFYLKSPSLKRSLVFARAFGKLLEKFQDEFGRNRVTHLPMPAHYMLHS